MNLESLNDDINKIKDDPLKDMPFIHADYGRTPIYAIMRIGRKYKSISTIKGFMKHMERLQDTPNADEERSKNNRIIYGPKDVYSDVKEYLKDCKIYKNSVVGRELLCSCSPALFKNMLPQDFEKWIDANRRWLLETFHENVRYAVLHLDETT